MVAAGSQHSVIRRTTEYDVDLGLGARCEVQHRRGCPPNLFAAGASS